MSKNFRALVLKRIYNAQNQIKSSIMKNINEAFLFFHRRSAKS